MHQIFYLAMIEWDPNVLQTKSLAVVSLSGCSSGICFKRAKLPNNDYKFKNNDYIY